MVLQPGQITKIRNTIGDTNTTDPDVSTDRLNELYADNDSDLPLTMLDAAYERLGILANEIDTTDSNTLITEKRKQRFDNLEKIIARLERQTSSSGGSLTTGRMRLGLDAREAD